MRSSSDAGSVASNRSHVEQLLAAWQPPRSPLTRPGRITAPSSVASSVASTPVLRPARAPSAPAPIRAAATARPAAAAATAAVAAASTPVAAVPATSARVPARAPAPAAAAPVPSSSRDPRRYAGAIALCKSLGLWSGQLVTHEPLAKGRKRKRARHDTHPNRPDDEPDQNALLHDDDDECAGVAASDAIAKSLHLPAHPFILYSTTLGFESDVSLSDEENEQQRRIETARRNKRVGRDIVIFDSTAQAPAPIPRAAPRRASVERRLVGLDDEPHADGRLEQLRLAHADMATQLHLHKQRLAAKGAAGATGAGGGTGTAASAATGMGGLSLPGGAPAAVSAAELAASAEHHFAQLRARYEAAERAQKAQSSAHSQLLKRTRRDRSAAARYAAAAAKAAAAKAATAADSPVAASPSDVNGAEEDEAQGRQEAEGQPAENDEDDEAEEDDDEEEDEDAQFFTLGQY